MAGGRGQRDVTQPQDLAVSSWPAVTVPRCL